ncbi:MAG: hypothetical protein DIZ80_08360 [endosymbiont of Galathealinum brachiosum]|uniref:Uncharacterized protein n=1 Tax=endosymbiont of Galathealinum brachiosum TaxID=2200906 RepID=A0A370DBP6_9GAMM|nr:MAG: hypothetical protein DIZ80_08360 [endosymbiont of Galathealinum brachiosum]
MTKKAKDKSNEKVAKKLEEMGLMPSEEESKSEETVVEKDQSNKTPYALILTVAMFATGIVGIVLSSGSSDVDAVATAPAIESVTPVENSAMAINQNSMADMMAERRKAMQESRQSIPMSENHPGLDKAKQPAWFKEHQAMRDKQQAQMLEQQQAMLEKQKAQQAQWKKQMQAQQQQWLKSQQWNRGPNMNMPQPATRAPVYYNPNPYYQPAPYYGPRRY